MTNFGYTMMTEQSRPDQLVRDVQAAERAASRHDIGDHPLVQMRVADRKGEGRGRQRRHLQFADQFPHEDPATRPGLILLQTHLAYERQLKNLHIQEGRLRRYHQKDTAELRQLQQERMRQEKEEEAVETATESASAANQNGFEFSTPETQPSPMATKTPQLPEPAATPYADAA